MKEITITLKTIDKVRRFVDIVSQYSESMDLQFGNYVVDAKSIMGIFSMDLTKPMQLKIYSSQQRFEVIQRELVEYIA